MRERRLPRAGCAGDEIEGELGQAPTEHLVEPWDAGGKPADRRHPVGHEQHAMSDRFISHMLSGNIRIEEDLLDQGGCMKRRIEISMARTCKPRGDADRSFRMTWGL
jgi:hypothetical protein